MAITTEQAINRLYSTYSKHGITKELITRLVMDGIKKQGFAPLDIYNLLRMSLGHEFNEREYFSLDDVMAITGETEEELAKRIEQYRVELLAAGENPDDYFKPIKPNKSTIYYFSDGLS